MFNEIYPEIEELTKFLMKNESSLNTMNEKFQKERNEILEIYHSLLNEVRNAT